MSLTSNAQSTTGQSPVQQFKALAHPSRLRILEVLRGGERNVGEIEDVSGIGQPALSQQLGVLRKAGLVITRRQAKSVYYRVDTQQLAGLADAMCAIAGPDKGPSAAVRKPSPGAAHFARMATSA